MNTRVEIFMIKKLGHQLLSHNYKIKILILYCKLLWKITQLIYARTGKTSPIRRHNCPRDWRLSASRGTNWGPLKPLIHHSTIVLRGLRGALDQDAIMPRDASFLECQYKFFLLCTEFKYLTKKIRIFFSKDSEYCASFGTKWKNGHLWKEGGGDLHIIVMKLKYILVILY